MSFIDDENRIRIDPSRILRRRPRQIQPPLTLEEVISKLPEHLIGVITIETDFNQLFELCSRNNAVNAFCKTPLGRRLREIRYDEYMTKYHRYYILYKKEAYSSNGPTHVYHEYYSNRVKSVDDAIAACIREFGIKESSPIFKIEHWPYWFNKDKQIEPPKRFTRRVCGCKLPTSGHPPSQSDYEYGALCEYREVIGDHVEREDEHNWKWRHPAGYRSFIDPKTGQPYFWRLDF